MPIFNKKFFWSWSVCLLLFSFVLVNEAQAQTLTDRLSGKILLRVESKGEAYYINPVDKKGYYLGRPNDAFAIMRSFGLGVSNKDLNTFLQSGARANLSGRILLQVEDKGQAYYINPDNLRLYYLGRPTDAFNIMRQLGLGISNYNLSQISLVSLNNNTNNNSTTPVLGLGEKLVNFSWKYKGKSYNLNQIFRNNLYNEYSGSSKVLYYSLDNPPSNLKDSYYGLFLEQKNGDDSIDKLILDLRNIADQESFTENEFLEFVMTFVQGIPYDFSKNSNSPQNFPYETLYKKSGVCSDKSFLALLILRKIGYGGVIFDYPEKQHSAVAVSCQPNSSYNSGYCFVETTNYFPIGVFPSSLDSGQAIVDGINWNNVFSGANFGEVEMYQKTTGQKSYSGMSGRINQVNNIIIINQENQALYGELTTRLSQLNILKAELDALVLELENYLKQQDFNNYNIKIAEYNLKAQNYNNLVNIYTGKLAEYDNKNIIINQKVNEFYQN